MSKNKVTLYDIGGVVMAVPWLTCMKLITRVAIGGKLRGTNLVCHICRCDSLSPTDHPLFSVNPLGPGIRIRSATHHMRATWDYDLMSLCDVIHQYNLTAALTQTASDGKRLNHLCHYANRRMGHSSG